MSDFGGVWSVEEYRRRSNEGLYVVVRNNDIPFVETDTTKVNRVNLPGVDYTRTHHSYRCMTDGAPFVGRPIGLIHNRGNVGEEPLSRSGCFCSEACMMRYVHDVMHYESGYVTIASMHLLRTKGVICRPAPQASRIDDYVPEQDAFQEDTMSLAQYRSSSVPEKVCDVMSSDDDVPSRPMVLTWQTGVPASS
ncbi:MAG: hypothetical protein CMK92_02745 [Pseudomonas sp.]|nr:hypothetical protein [Pseudomonas sp.]